MKTPWTEIVIETKHYTVYKDGFPVTDGHLLFVPKEETWECLAYCYKFPFGQVYQF